MYVNDQGALILGDNHFLFAVNAGSNEISVLSVGKDSLTLLPGRLCLKNQRVALGPGQYRNAVVSGSHIDVQYFQENRTHQDRPDATALRY